jgi:hypothetical protein
MVQHVMEHAREPQKLWITESADHHFIHNLAELDQCLLEAITWITRHSAR